MSAIFQPQIVEKNQWSTVGQGTNHLHSDPKLLWQDSDKGVGHTSTFPESILHKIIIIIIIKNTKI